jgi:hypothetical protein
MSWLARNSPQIEAAAALTALVAVAALIGVKWQLDKADRLSRLQSARDSYRGHLALAVSVPEMAQPADGCALLAGPRSAAYQAFVDHLLYSAEQSLSTESGRDDVFLDQLAWHQDYLWAHNAPLGDTPEVASLISRFRIDACTAAPPCQTD